MRFLSRLTSPLVRLLSWSTELVLKIFGHKPAVEAPVTEEEIKVLIDQGRRAASLLRPNRIWLRRFSVWETAVLGR